MLICIMQDFQIGEKKLFWSSWQLPTQCHVMMLLDAPWCTNDFSKKSFSARYPLRSNLVITHLSTVCHITHANKTNVIERV